MTVLSGSPVELERGGGLHVVPWSWREQETVCMWSTQLQGVGTKQVQIGVSGGSFILSRDVAMCL